MITFNPETYGDWTITPEISFTEDRYKVTAEHKDGAEAPGTNLLVREGPRPADEGLVDHVKTIVADVKSCIDSW